MKSLKPRFSIFDKYVCDAHCTFLLLVNYSDGSTYTLTDIAKAAKKRNKMKSIEEQVCSLNRVDEFIYTLYQDIQLYYK